MINSRNLIYTNILDLTHSSNSGKLGKLFLHYDGVASLLDRITVKSTL